MDERPPLRTEIAAGVTTFLTTAYIVVVNPAILSDGTGIPFAGAMTATVLTAFLATLAMGLYANLPYALAPGMGLNAFFTYTLVLGRGVPWQTALGLVFLSGLLFLAASVTPVRMWIARSIPPGLRAAAAAGIGLFLTFIGLKNAGFVAADPVTLVKPGTLGAPAVCALIGGGTAVWLLKRKSPYAFLASIAAATAAGALAGAAPPPKAFVSAPDFSLFGELDIASAITLSLLPALITLTITDLFDTLSTLLGVAQAADMLDEEGHPVRLKEALIVDAAATTFSGIAGTSPTTTYIESSAGVEVGGRTGRTAVVAALCFLPCLFLAPAAGAVPAFATAPVLVLVGAFMFRSVSLIPKDKIEESVPPFLTVILIPLTFSITQGILWGFLSHAVLFSLVGRRREVHPAMWTLAVISALLLVLENAA
jgi:AGZA family xanthine/uracil permease-like MFS transporter